MAYTFAQLEQVWINAGGDPQYAKMAAAVAMAESSGDPNATNHNNNGSWDMGLWQINMSGRDTSWFDVNKNAREAIRQSRNGRDWHPWCVAFTDGACGTKGGAYDFNGSPAGKYLKSNGGVLPAGGTPGGSGSGSGLSIFDPGSWVSAAVSALVAPLVNMIVIALEMGGGVLLMVAGVGLFVWSNPSVRKTAQNAAQVAAVAAL